MMNQQMKGTTVQQIQRIFHLSLASLSQERHVAQVAQERAEKDQYSDDGEKSHLG
jgi:hypothetical protein